MHLSTIFLILTLISSLALVVYLIYLGRRGPDKHYDSNLPPSTPMGLDLKPFVLWNSFYMNPQDPRGWVPKISGLGRTVNFRNRLNILIFSVFLLDVVFFSLAHIYFLINATTSG
jgi:uncharacterized membrane protein